VPRPVHVATLGAAHGVKGELRAKSLTAEPAAFAAYGPFTTERGDGPFVIAACRPLRQDLFLVRFSGIDDRTGAERVAGSKLLVPRTRLPALPAEEFYCADLIGLSARHASGALVGAVIAVENYGAGDILVIRPADGAETILLPFTRAVVPIVDIAGGALVVVPPGDDAELAAAEVAQKNSQDRGRR
jgi:16S rRNA processing protein RimM